MSTDNPFGAYALGEYRNRILRWAQETPVNWLGRRVSLILRKIILLSGAVVIDSEVDGLRLRLYMKDNVSERKFLFMPQFFDCDERALLKEKLKEGDVFIDIGANAGIYTMTAAGPVGKTGKVVAIEPNPAALSRLTFNASLNGFEKRIICEQVGVSDREGSFDLILDESNLGGSSLVTARSDKKIKVDCHPLLDILKKHGIEKTAALKIDIEGAEDKVLIPFFRDAPKSLYPKILIVENSPKDWEKDLPAACRAAGYNLLKITRMNQIWALS